MSRRRRLLSRESSRSLSIAFTLVLASGLVAGTSASFNAGTDNRDNKMAMAALTAPTALTATPAAGDVNLAWGAGSFGGGTGFGHRVMVRNLGVEPGVRDGLDGPASTCSASDTFTSTPARTGASTTSVTHTGAVSGAAGSYACYRVETEYPASPATAQWFSQTGNPVATVMLGHVVRTVTAVNGGGPGDVDEGDSFVLTFNQAVNIATGPVTTDDPSGSPTTGHDVCVDSSSGTINLGRVAIGTNCGAGQAVTVGRITGLTMTPGGERPGYHATYTWSDCPTAGQCHTLTILLGRRYRDNKTVTVTGTTSPSFAPTATVGWLQSASGAGQLCNITNTATQTCRPVPTGTV